MKKEILFLCLLLLLACNPNTTAQQQDYEQCISFCASSLDTPSDTPDDEAVDFVTIELCRRECEEKFLN